MPTIEDLEESVKNLSKKFDSVLTKLDALTPKEDAKDEVNPLQAKLDADAEIFRGLLEGKFPEEKLKSYTHDQLFMALEMKTDALPELNPMPSGKEDSGEYDRYDYMKPTFGGK